MFGVLRSGGIKGEPCRAVVDDALTRVRRRASGRSVRPRASLRVLVACLCLPPAFSALAGGTPATNGGASSAQKLLTPAGPTTTLANGEYVTNTAGLNSHYSFFIEVPPGTPRLRVQLFDPDTNAALNDDGASTFRYTLIDPSEAQRATALSSDAGPAAANNAWWTFYDSSTVTAYVLDQFGTAVYTNSDGTLPWSTPWLEENDDNSPTTGRIFITITGGTLRMNPQNVTDVAIARGADLRSLSSVTLSFTTDGNGLENNGDERLAIEYSIDGGSSWTLLQDILLSNAATPFSFSGLTPSATFRVRFRRSGSGWANNDREYVDIDDVRMEGPLAAAPAPAAGHWEVQMAGTTGNGANGVGVRADDGDGDATAGGTELNVYYDSFFNYGTTNGVRTFTDYPWVTSGCSVVSNDFDGDGGGTVRLTSRTGAFATATFPVSGATVWQGFNVTGWTSASDATDYGLWSTDVSMTTALNCITYYLGAFNAAAAPPTGQPQPNALRVYLPTDAGGKPAKPYLEQLVRWASGPNPPVPGQTTRFGVTVRLVNPTAHPITFSNAAGNVVTANVPGSGAVYAAGTQLSQGSVVSQPSVGSAGSVVWDPGVVATGSTVILGYQVNVTPAAAGTVAVTGSPLSAGTTARYFDETGNTSQVARTRNTLGPLCQLSVSTNAPTLALLGEARVTSATPGVVLEWETVSEAGTAGFEVYRLEGGERTLVHSGLLESSLSPAGARYRLHDRDARPRGPLAYEIVEVETSGARRSHGTVTFDAEARDGGGESVPEAEYAYERRAADPERANRAAVETASAFSGSPLGATKAVVDLEGSELFVSAGKAGDPAMRIETATAGLTSVTFSQIAKGLGISPQKAAAEVRSGGLSLQRHDGLSSAWTETGDGILFYAQPYEGLYARGSVYWLRLGHGQTMATRVVRPATTVPAGASFEETLKLEEDAAAVVALPLDPSADYWLWKSLVAGRAGSDQVEIPFTVPGMAAGRVRLGVGLQGGSAPGSGRHHIRVLVNGVLAGESSFTGYDRRDATFDLPAGVLRDGANSLVLEALLDAGTAQSVVFLDSFEVAYPRRYDAQGASGLVFAATAGASVSVAGLPAGVLSLYDLTDPAKPVRLLGFAARAGELRFVAPSRSTRFVAVADGAARQPFAVGTAESVNLRKPAAGGARYVVVTSAALRAPSVRLAALRGQQGLPSMVVTFQSIADQFGGGLRDPEALRSFVEYAVSSWSTKPKYVVLAGSGTYDYRDLLGYGANHVPVALVGSDGGLVPADQDYVTSDSGALLPVAIGRIPARTAEELAAAIDKIVAYEGAPGSPAWASRALFLADNTESGADFGAASDGAAQRLTLPLTIERLYLGPSPAAAVRSSLLARLGEGLGLLSYFGHAGLDRLAVEGLLVTGDVATLPAVEGTPVVVALTCVLNRIGIPGFRTLGETLAARAGAGAAAVWSSGGLSDNASALALARCFYATLSSRPGGRLGDAIADASAAYTEAGGLEQTLAFYNLLGDPALRVREPAMPPAPTPGPGTER